MTLWETLFALQNRTGAAVVMVYILYIVTLALSKVPFWRDPSYSSSPLALGGLGERTDNNIITIII